MISQQPTKAIILAGGKGTRLYPVTLETPKPLLTVNRKPIINHLISNFREYGVNNFRIIIRPQDKEEFYWWKKRYQDNFPEAEIVFDLEREPMGTFGFTYHNLRDWIGDEDFFLTNGDELKNVDLRKMMDFHKDHDADATIALVKVENPSEYGVARVNGDRIIEFLEKPENPLTNLISGGLYLLSSVVFDYAKDSVKNRDEYLMVEKHIFPRIAEKGKLFGFKHLGEWFDCGTLSRWEDAIKKWPAIN